MTTRTLVDAELLPFLELAPNFEYSDASLPAIRAGFALPVGDEAVPIDGRVAKAAYSIPGHEGAAGTRVFVYRPKATGRDLPVVLHMHGGGFLFGSAEMGEERHAQMAIDFDCAIVSVDYRLAPENKYPAAIDDCYSALVWVAENAAALGFDDARIAVRGESAGGGLAASLVVLAKERDGPAICHANLIYPMLDDRTGLTLPSNPGTGEFVWSRSSNIYAWRAYLGEMSGGPDTPGAAAAARAQDLTGLPSVFIGSAALDLFLDENLDFANRLIAAGVPTELYVAPGAFHGFEVLGADSWVARYFIERAADAVRRALA